MRKLILKHAHHFFPIRVFIKVIILLFTIEYFFINLENITRVRPEG